LHYVQSWKSDAEIAPQRLNIIDFLVNRCGANVNIQVIVLGLTSLTTYTGWAKKVSKKGKGKDVHLYSAFHAPGTPNALASLKLDRQTAI